MITVGAFEAKTKFSELLDRVERGETVIITRHGEPVARMSADKPTATVDGKRRALEAVRRKLKAANVAFDAADIISARDEGRK
jgi:prevent-host-death family protein